MAELDGRVALVTGASRGIGAATARALAAAGARVIVTDVADTSGLAQELGGLAHHQDVTDEGDWAETVAFARGEAGGLDILVNNAGVFTRQIGPITEISLEEWRRVHSVNVEGVFLGCKHAIPALADARRSGKAARRSSICRRSPASRDTPGRHATVRPRARCGSSPSASPWSSRR